MAHGVRLALRTAQPTGRQDYWSTPTPVSNDQQVPVSDTQPLPAQLSKPPTSSGDLVPVPSQGFPIYNTSAVGNVTGINTTAPQILSREA